MIVGKELEKAVLDRKIESQNTRLLARLENRRGKLWMQKTFNRIKYQSKQEVGIKYWNKNHHDKEMIENREYSQKDIIY